MSVVGRHAPSSTFPFFILLQSCSLLVASDSSSSQIKSRTLKTVASSCCCPPPKVLVLVLVLHEGHAASGYSIIIFISACRTQRIYLMLPLSPFRLSASIYQHRHVDGFVVPLAKLPMLTSRNGPVRTYD